ncbi:hypothetical protein MXB_4981 [Myxobolus squamalis]|nr:hypothetical protein MXB_4981 [Myxobolus squamalis]
MTEVLNIATWIRIYSKYPGVLVIDCHADWCLLCRGMDFFMERVSADCSWMKAIKINFTRNPIFSYFFGIHGYPTLLVFVDGVEKERVSGFDVEEMTKAILRHRPITSI